MHTKYHTLIGTLLAAITYTIQNITATLASPLLSWTLDIDRAINHIVHEKPQTKPNKRPRTHPNNIHYNSNPHRHNNCITAMLAYPLHLLTDTITNPIHPQTMLLAYRATKQFKISIYTN